MSPLKFTAIAKTTPSRSDDVAEPFRAAHEAGQGFGDVMEHTLRRADQKSPDRQHQPAQQAIRPDQSQKTKEVVEDTADDASTAKSDDSTKAKKTDPLTTPLSLAASLHLYPLIVEVAKAGSIVDGGGANIVPPTDGKAPTATVAADSKAVTAKSLLVAAGRTAAPVAAAALPLKGQGKSTATVPGSEDLTSLAPAKISPNAVSDLSAGDKTDAHSALSSVEKPDTNDNTTPDGKNAVAPANTDKTAVPDTSLQSDGIGNSFMQSAELATNTAAAAGDPITAAEEQGQSPAISMENPTGISAAQQDVQMKKADKKNKFAGVEKDLPEAPALKAAGDNLTSQNQKPVVVPMSGERTEAPANNSLNSVSTEHPLQVTAASSSTVSLTSPVADIRARAIDRTEDILMLQSTRLSDMSTDTLKVTIRPGAGIELAVELHHGEQGIEASATLRNGDYHFLNSNWSDLQQRLESRGVRLSPLTCSEQFSNSNTNTNTSQFQQPRQQPGQQDEPAYAGAFADFVMAGSIAKQTTQTVSPRGWESWA